MLITGKLNLSFIRLGESRTIIARAWVRWHECANSNLRLCGQTQDRGFYVQINGMVNTEQHSIEFNRPKSRTEITHMHSNRVSPQLCSDKLSSLQFPCSNAARITSST